MNKFSIIFLASVLVISSNISAQTSDQEKSSWWDTTKKFLDDSQKNITDRVGNINKTLDEEIEELYLFEFCNYLLKIHFDNH